MSLITAVTPPLVLQLYRVRLYYYNHAKIFFDPFPLPLPSLNFDPRKKKLLYRDRDAVILCQLKFPLFLSRRAGKNIHIYIYGCDKGEPMFELVGVPETRVWIFSLSLCLFLSETISFSLPCSPGKSKN